MHDIAVHIVPVGMQRDLILIASQREREVEGKTRKKKKGREGGGAKRRGERGEAPTGSS